MPSYNPSGLAPSSSTKPENYFGDIGRWNVQQANQLGTSIHGLALPPGSTP
jgi:hypothetical protein